MEIRRKILAANFLQFYNQVKKSFHLQVSHLLRTIYIRGINQIYKSTLPIIGAESIAPNLEMKQLGAI